MRTAGTAATTAIEDATTAAWREQLRGPVVPCPWDTQGGRKKGEPIETWRCPRCGGLEMNDCMLQINHGTMLAIPNEVGCKRTVTYSGALEDPYAEPPAPVQSSIVIDTETSGEGPKQEALPPAAIASTTAASLCATIGAQLEVTARQTYPDDLVEIDRELMQVQALREIAKWANEQAIRKAQRAARKPGATLSKVGAALGVSRQRVHQLLYPDGRY